MADLTKYILQALYEATGHSGQPVDVVATLRARWPQLRAEDVRMHLSELSARALVAMRADGFGAITGLGIRALSKLWTDGAFGAVPPSAAAHVDRLHALAASQQEVDVESNDTQPYSMKHMQRISDERRGLEADPSETAPVALVQRKSVAPAAAQSPVDQQIDYMRRAVEGIIQEISAATDLPMEDWSNALEQTAQLDSALDTLSSVLHR